MTSMSDYTKVAEHKDLVSGLLKQIFTGIDPKDYAEMTNLVSKKIHNTYLLKKSIAEDNKEYLEEAARIHGVEFNTVLDSFMLFLLIVENIGLAKQLNVFG